ncbi:MAG: hypothetical protein SGPRY_004916, partial [Prymnesium sp.]
VASVEGIAGRPVRQRNHLMSWLKASEHNSSLKKLAELLKVKETALNTVVEMNGGILIFNNRFMMKIGWLQLCLNIFNRLTIGQWVVEGDQDLISCVLAAHPQIPWNNLHPEYNYGFGRDREPPLSHRANHRLRHGMIAGALVNAHFVQDGKPWQHQQLDEYPPWLATARVAYLQEWLHVAYRILSNKSTEKFQILFPLSPKGSADFMPPPLHSIVNYPFRQICGCFLRKLQREGAERVNQLLRSEISLNGTGEKERIRISRMQHAEFVRIINNRKRLDRLLVGKMKGLASDHRAISNLHCTSTFNLSRDTSHKS